MSNSVLNNKFKKWSSLLAQNPDNLDYKHKVSKYGTLMVRAVQGGGSGNGEVDELLRKIDGVVRKNNMNGGGKQVTGYRNMRGGAGGEEDAQQIGLQITELTNIISQQQKAFTNMSNEFRDTIIALISKLKEQRQEINDKHQEILNASTQLDAAVSTALANAATNQSENERAHAAAMEQLKAELATARQNAQADSERLTAEISTLEQKLKDLRLVGETAVAANRGKLEIELTKTKRLLETQKKESGIFNIKSSVAAVEGLAGGTRRTTRRH
jgi:hypothetical protein